MIYTRFGGNEVKILNITDTDHKCVRGEVHHPSGRIVTRTIAVRCLDADGGINEIMARIRELTGGTP